MRIRMLIEDKAWRTRVGAVADETDDRHVLIDLPEAVWDHPTTRVVRSFGRPTLAFDLEAAFGPLPRDFGNRHTAVRAHPRFVPDAADRAMLESRCQDSDPVVDAAKADLAAWLGR